MHANNEATNYCCAEVSPLSPPLHSVRLASLFAVFFFGEDLTYIFYVELQLGPTAVRIMGLETKREELPPFAIGKNEEGCGVFSGRWNFDESTRPLYEESECPYIQPQLTFQEHGRPDKVPEMALADPRLRSSQLQRHFDARDTTREEDDEYNATIEFHWAPFLLESNSDDAVVHKVSEKIVRKGCINKHGKHWEGVDILVFNTYLWWMTALFKFKILLWSIDDEVKNVVEMPTMEAYRMAMKSLERWVQKNMDPEKTRVFFTSMSPVHGKSTDWGGDRGGSCYNQTTLSEDPNYKGSDSTDDIMQIIGEVFNKSKVPITFLNITQLSSYRKDAHTSIYKKQRSRLSPEQLANPIRYDCVHWCLPGLQDTWNELLFAKLFYPLTL
ncbi:hypothetical protein PS2_001504 [Malus domestica]